MNLACVLPLHACWVASLERTLKSEGRFLAKRLAWHSLLALSLGSLLGGLLYWWGDDAVKAAWARLPARAYWFALSELVFSAACVGGLIWLFRSVETGTEPSRKRARLGWLIALLSSTNLLYHFPPLMSVLGKLTANPSWSQLEELPRRHLLVLMKEPEVIAMSVHFAMASLAVASVYTLWVYAGLWIEEPAAAQGKQMAGVALIVTLLQFGVGVWLLASLSSESRGRLLGEDAIAAIAFAGAIFGTLLLSGSLANIALGKVSHADCHKVALWTLLTVLLMTLALSRLHSPEATSAEKEPRQRPAAAIIVKL